ncbi:chaperone NapD [Amaricoccus sp. W119]|uniref:chaperone NapD n=1 Tax=Amaricoccus sp. W119 TaxID=3391833 RepID=UPI0039A52E4E
MPANASNELSRRGILGLPDESFGHISSLIVRAHPDRMEAVAARIARLSVAEVAMTDPSGKIIVTLETRDEDEIVAAMNAMQRFDGVVNVALVFHQSDA